MGNNLDRQIEKAVNRLPAGEGEEDARGQAIVLLKWVFRNVKDKRLSIKAFMVWLQGSC